MEAVLNFVINEIFGQGAIFIALIACIGLILQKKPFSEIVRGTVMTAVASSSCRRARGSSRATRSTGSLRRSTP